MSDIYGTEPSILLVKLMDAVERAIKGEKREGGKARFLCG